MMTPKRCCLLGISRVYCYLYVSELRIFHGLYRPIEWIRYLENREEFC